MTEANVCQTFAQDCTAM